MNDQETQVVLSEQQRLSNFVNGDDWKVVRLKLSEKILELQNAFSIDDDSPEKMLVNLQARKMASSILFDFLKQVEGDASAMPETRAVVDRAHIFRV